jgi:phosphatidylserine/phosphatidylglycerophosphate/cardiolipin synthase-like enzyme
VDGSNASAPLLEPGRNCWRIEEAGRAALIVDAAEYFHLAREAMLKAQSQILLIGWDFDTRIFLDKPRGDEAPLTLGPLLSWLGRNRPELSIHILNWNIGAAKLLGRGTTILRVARWALSKRVHFRLDAAHPVGGSHHHKIVVIDDRLAFCGGIDMTATRWDTREHKDHDRSRKRPTTGRYYGPWHDATMAVDGGAARALGELSRERWQRAGGASLPAPEAEGDPWPQALEPMFRDLPVAIARTRGAYGDAEAVREIEALFVDMILRAQRFVYAENQFFASRVIAEAVAKRLGEADGPEFVIVNPRRVDGVIEEAVMSPARAVLMEQLTKADRHGRLRIYTPVTTHGEDIYVHSKILIVDDAMLRVGSANMNNRSMGLDSECDLLIEAEPERPDVSERIAAIRADLLGEHLGTRPEQVASVLRESGSLIATVEKLRAKGRTLLPLQADPPNELQRAMAERELLDPESTAAEKETATRPGLLHGVRRLIGRR